MSEQDKFDLEAEALLPCVMAQLCIDYSACGEHHQYCPAHYRPAVASALRAQAERIERLEAALEAAPIQRLDQPSSNFILAYKEWYREVRRAALEGK